jgi:beta-phosphoglucomutase
LLRAVVFDFDGVIANSEPLHYRAFHDVLAEAGIDLSEKDYLGRYLGYDDVGVFKAVAADRRLTWPLPRIAELVTSKARQLERLEEGESILFPGADAAIRRLGARVPLAIASGALAAEIQRVLDRARLSSCFKVIVAAEHTAVGKPAPDPYLRALELLVPAVGAPLRPSECIAIEDSPWGLQSARAAGLHTIAVAHTYEHAALDAEVIVSSLDELDIEVMQRLCTV